MAGEDSNLTETVQVVLVSCFPCRSHERCGGKLGESQMEKKWRGQQWQPYLHETWGASVEGVCMCVRVCLRVSLHLSLRCAMEWLAAAVQALCSKACMGLALLCINRSLQLQLLLLFALAQACKDGSSLPSRLLSLVFQLLLHAASISCTASFFPFSPTKHNVLPRVAIFSHTIWQCRTVQ